MKQPLQLETARLVGRPISQDCFEDFRGLLQDPLVREHLGGPRSDREVLERFQKHTAHWERYGFGARALYLRETGEFAGIGGVRFNERDGPVELELFYSFHTRFWRHGLATEFVAAVLAEAFRRADAEAVVAWTRPSNIGSQRVLERAGFTLERQVARDGDVHLRYSLGRTAWKQARP